MPQLILRHFFLGDNMGKISNNANIPLALAVWAVNDDYDYQPDPDYFSVTSLLKPIKQIVLSRRVPPELETADVEDYVASALGSSIHAGIEKAWKENYKKNLKALGYSDSLINRVKINPEPEELQPDTIPIYMEQRHFKKFRGFTIGGKYDLVAEGILHDNKSTSAYTYVFGGKDEDYKLQGSFYRWLCPDKITEDFIRINFIFTDWQKTQAKRDENYPQHRLISKDIPLYSLEETEQIITGKLELIRKYRNSPEEDIPECTDEDLWRSPTKYKYYSNPEKTDGRSTKNFDSLEEAHNYLRNEKFGKGIIITVPGEVKRCLYCSAAPICKQRLKYFEE